MNQLKGFYYRYIVANYYFAIAEGVRFVVIVRHWFKQFPHIWHQVMGHEGTATYGRKVVYCIQFWFESLPDCIADIREQQRQIREKRQK